MEMSKFLKAVWFTPGVKHRWGLPMLFEGKPGTAKTSMVEQAAVACGLHCEVLIGSLREPSDFLGLPIPEKAGDRTRTAYASPTWVDRVTKAGRAVVPFDEINTAPPATQAALLRVVLEGFVGDDKVPDTVRFVAMMNATEDAAGGWDLAPPLANRFGHFKWDVPDSETWGDWLLAGANGHSSSEAFDPKAEEERVLKAWPTPWAKSRGLVAGFIRKRPELLFKMPNAGDPAASKAWPSPRTWEYAARAIAGSEVHELDEVNADALLAAFVGASAASEFTFYRKEADLPDPADLLDGKVTFKHEPKRLDRTVAVFSACAALVTSPKAEKQADRCAALWKMCAEVMKDAADVVVPAARALVRAKLSRVSEAKPVLVKLQPILAAAGIAP